MRECVARQIQQLLAEHGVASQLKRRRKHEAVLFEVGWEKVIYTCPKTASDHRTVKNCLADIRRILRQHSLAGAI